MSWDGLQDELAEMFDEYSHRTYDVQLVLSKRAAEKRVRDCEYAVTYRARLKLDPNRLASLALWKREYMREYEKRRRREEPEFRAIRNKRAREGMRRVYARKQAELAAKRMSGVAPSSERAPYQCRACGGEGHNTRTCAQMKRAA